MPRTSPGARSSRRTPRPPYRQALPEGEAAQYAFAGEAGLLQGPSPLDTPGLEGRPGLVGEEGTDER